jgi:23S rRNA (cytidine1920-2'-O)/16S rRNA (cytidine1409-2'-O)-methyltransferase
VKPQFEVGRGNVGKGGQVKDPEARTRVVAEVKAWLEESGWTVLHTAECTVLGGEGAREHLLMARRA